eukprot:TRINITY_DN89043_c0_g1_i1.p1 TRINITY_DN89043_c0_g1~~TRINITY_DN89043_c0_g1_i1.p1  ORF type:complete len:455 (+),score=89.17 TRINITY_DN89043_c0_g1_i1:45-1409(+)
MAQTAEPALASLELPRFVALQAFPSEAAQEGSTESLEQLEITAAVASRIPYVVSALANDWKNGDREQPESGASDATWPEPPVVQVFMPAGCPVAILRALLGRLAMDADSIVAMCGLSATWQAVPLSEALQLAQVASMLQLDDIMPELVELVRKAVETGGDLAELEATCQRLQLPAAVQEAAAAAKLAPGEPASLPDIEQVQGMISSALHTADGKVWRVVQKVIDRREAWPRLAKENAALLLGFARGSHGSIRATPHTGFFWGSRDFLYLVCRYIRSRPEIFDAMVTAMFEEVYTMDPELPAEVIDAVFKELLVHDGLTFSQCEHVIAKLMQHGEQMEYLFHEWSGVFPALPGSARQALSKGLLPLIGRCPHVALDFVLKELDNAPAPKGGSRSARACHLFGNARRCLRRRCPYPRRQGSCAGLWAGAVLVVALPALPAMADVVSPIFSSLRYRW